ncbi:hypothetical protein H310_03116 [Aphanomyces invadans]|uniref:Fibronectin type-III domain-containing protein n=1 Tax=Aphanomyces invadans TaxID=157072 RepID=A0A024UN37_9STRA|nr:hypothetical protein H310_03116 [Aphanomyces invadans]ETW07023.1 hypothetical protein H310_03116 [Aphanomyces invadans]|eukprot:XP_008865098.1 hypothetical protein H310_03116 [Aphanomyces invadans]
MASTSAYQISLEPDRDTPGVLLHSTESSPFLNYDTLLDHASPSSSSELESLRTVDLTSPSALHHDLYAAFDSNSSSPGIMFDVPPPDPDSVSPTDDVPVAILSSAAIPNTDSLGEDHQAPVSQSPTAVEMSTTHASKHLSTDTTGDRRLDPLQPFVSFHGHRISPSDGREYFALDPDDGHHDGAAFKGDMALGSHHPNKQAQDLLTRLCCALQVHYNGSICNTSSDSSHSFVSVEWTVVDAVHGSWRDAHLYNVTFQLANESHDIHTIFDDVAVDRFLSSPVVHVVSLPPPRSLDLASPVEWWFRLGLTGVAAHDEGFFADWMAVPMASPLPPHRLDFHTTATPSTVSFHWSPWPSNFVWPHVRVAMRREFGGRDVGGHFEWFTAFDGAVPPDEATVTIPSLTPNAWYTCRVTVRPTPRPSHIRGPCGILWTQSRDFEWMAVERRVCTAPLALSWIGIGGHWWIHVDAIDDSFQHVTTEVDVTTATRRTSVNRVDLSGGAGVALLEGVQDRGEYMVQVIRTGCIDDSSEPTFIAKSDVVHLSTHSPARLPQLHPHPTNPVVVTWRPLTTVLASFLATVMFVNLEQQVVADGTWVVVASVSKDDQAFNTTASATQATTSGYRLAAYAVGADALRCIATSNTVYIMQPVVLVVEGLGRHATLRFDFRLPEHVLHLFPRDEFDVVVDGVPHRVASDIVGCGGTYAVDWAFESSAMHRVAVVPVVVPASDTVVVQLEPPGVSYVPSWPSVALNVAVITHSSATCQLQVEPWSSHAAPSIQCQVDIHVLSTADGWTMQWHKAIDRDRSSSCHRIHLDNLSSHTVVPVRVRLRVRPTHMWEDVVTTQIVTACGALSIAPTDNGGLLFSWREPSPAVGLSYGIQGYNASRGSFETWYTTDRSPFATPPLAKPFHLLLFRLQTHVEFHIPLDGVPQLALTNPDPPTLETAVARHAILAYKSLNLAHIPAADRRQLTPALSSSAHLSLETIRTAVNDSDDTTSTHPPPVADLKVLGAAAVSPLQPHTTYRARLRCTLPSNGATLTCASQWVHFTTAKAAPDAPAAICVDEVFLPYLSSIPATMACSYVRVSWQAPRSNGEPIAGYAVEMAWAAPSHEGEWTWHGVYVGPATSFCPTAGQLRTMRRPLETVVAFRVQAANALGWSSFCQSGGHVCIGLPQAVAALAPECIAPQDAPNASLVRSKQAPAHSLLPPVRRRPAVDENSPCQVYLNARQHLVLPRTTYQQERRAWYLATTVASEKSPTTTQRAISVYRCPKKRGPNPAT